MTTQNPQTDLQQWLNRMGLTGPAAQWLGAGRQSPVPVPSQETLQRARPVRAILLWLFSAPLLFAALSALAFGRFDGFVADVCAWGLVALAAVLTRRSSLQPPIQVRRRFARRWQFPLRNLAALLLGAGTGTAAVLGIGHGLAVGIGFAGVAILGYHFLYGLQPLRVGASPSAPDRDARAVIEALAEAEERLINIERSAAQIQNPELSARLGRIAQLGRGILVQIAERPTDLRRARRFLTVFLEGAEQVSEGYAKAHHYADSGELEQNFRAVLINIEEQFTRQRERLREADLLDLDVRIEVLKKQLDQEGIR